MLRHAAVLFRRDVQGEAGLRLPLQLSRVHPPRPEGARPPAATAFNNPRPIANIDLGDGKACVTYISPGTWLRYDNVDFGGGTTNFEAVVASPARRRR